MWNNFFNCFLETSKEMVIFVKDNVKVLDSSTTKCNFWSKSVELTLHHNRKSSWLKPHITCHKIVNKRYFKCPIILIGQCFICNELDSQVPPYCCGFNINMEFINQLLHCNCWSILWKKNFKNYLNIQIMTDIQRMFIKLSVRKI